MVEHKNIFKESSYIQSWIASRELIKIQTKNLQSFHPCSLVQSLYPNFPWKLLDAHFLY